jgi:hypothetical protein
MKDSGGFSGGGEEVGEIGWMAGTDRPGTVLRAVETLAGNDQIDPSALRGQMGRHAGGETESIGKDPPEEALTPGPSPASGRGVNSATFL